MTGPRIRRAEPRRPPPVPPVTLWSCRLDLPYLRPPPSLSGNTRSHWRVRTADTRRVRDDVMRLAQAAGLHRLPFRVAHVAVELVWAPGDRRVRDADNLWPLLKVCCDALARRRADLIGLDLVPDDSPEWMTKLAPRIAGPPAVRGMWVVVTLQPRPR